MKVLITGAGGMIGRKLTARLVATKEIAGETIRELLLHDVVPLDPPEAAEVPMSCLTGDLAEAAQVEQIVSRRPDVIFHLAAIVSGEAEKDFEKGYRVNLEGTQQLLEAVRRSGFKPRFVFASSVAVFGAPLPEPIPDTYHSTPLTSYGTQKAICELLISDYSRRGFVDGIALRLPTICVRPGKPNAAASGFFSGIIREPLSGQQAILPVSDDVLHWHASPRSAVGFLLHAAELDLTQVGANRAITMPGVAVTVRQQIDALERVAGAAVAARIVRQEDPFVQQIVSGWPRCFEPSRALTLGFQAENSFDEIIQVHIQDELSGVIA